MSKQLKIVCYEKVNIDVLQYIIKNFDTYMSMIKRRGGNDFFDDAELKAYTTIIKTYDSCVKKSGKYKGYKQTVYTQRREKLTKNAKEYTKHFGRVFPDGALSLCNLSRVLRHTIAGDLYFDIDIKNCHPTIALNYCIANDIKCDALQDFVSNREFYYDETKKYLGDTCNPKKIFVSLLNNGSFPRQDCEALFAQGETSIPEIHPKVKYFLTQIKDIINEVCLKEPEYYAVAQSLSEERKRERGYENPKGSCINYMMCEKENELLLLMKRELEAMGWINNDVCVLCWDGIMVLKNFDIETLNMDILKIEKVILDEITFGDKKLSHPFKLTVKTMEEGFKNLIPVDIPECISNIKTLSAVGDYITNKEIFEKTNFKIRNETVYCEEVNGYHIRRTESKLEQAFRNLQYFNSEKEKCEEFVPTWIRDSELRCYDSIGMYPEGCGDGIYNLWDGYEASHIPPSAEPFSTECLFQRHIRRLCNDDENVYGYLFKFLAQIVQFPHLKTGISILIKSVEGAGKDTLLHIMEAVLGKKYCFDSSNVDRDIFGRFNSVLENKILVCLNESNESETKKHMPRFKDLITCTTMKVEEKGLSIRTVRDMARYILFTNKEFPLFLEEGQRRFFVICSERARMPLEESTAVYKAIEDSAQVRRFYDYLTNIELESPKYLGIMPTTEYQEELKEACRPLEYLFLRDYCQSPEFKNKMFVSDLYSLYLSFIVRIGYETAKCCKLPSFSLKFRKYVIDAGSGITRSDNGNIRIDGKQAKGFIFDADKMVEYFGCE